MVNPAPADTPNRRAPPDDEESTGVERALAHLATRVARVSKDFSDSDRSPESLLTRARDAEERLVVSNAALLSLTRLVETSAENLRISDVALHALTTEAAQGKEKLHASELALLALTRLTENAKQAMSVGGVALEALNSMAFYDQLTELPNRRPVRRGLVH